MCSEASENETRICVYKSDGHDPDRIGQRRKTDDSCTGNEPCSDTCSVSNHRYAVVEEFNRLQTQTFDHLGDPRIFEYSRRHMIETLFLHV